MADFDKVIVDGVNYTVKDTTARDSVDTLASTVADGYIPNEGNDTTDEFVMTRDRFDLTTDGGDISLTATNGGDVRLITTQNDSGIFLDTNSGDKAYYNNVEIATVDDITSATGNFIPNDGNQTNDDFTLTRGAIEFNTRATSDFSVDCSADIYLRGTGANSSIDLTTTGTGTATYNGVEIATVSDISTATAGFIPNAGNTTADGLNITRTGGAINLISTDGQGSASSFSMTQTGDTSIGGTGSVNITGPGNISGSVGGSVSLNGSSGVYLNGRGSYGDFGNTTASKITISNGSSNLTIDNSISSPRTTLTNTADVMLQVGNGNMHVKSESLTGGFNSGHQLLTNYTINSGYLRNLNSTGIEAGVYNSLLSTSLTNAINTPNKNDFHLNVYGADGGTIARNLVFGNCPNYAQYFTFDNVIFSNVVDTLMYNDNTNALERFIKYKGCTFEHTTAPITSPTISKGSITFENCVFNGDLQVLLQGDYSVNIINCVFKGTTGIDIQLASGATWTGKSVVTGNHFTNGGAVTIATVLTGIENWNNV